jgi:hypothetical protein
MQVDSKGLTKLYGKSPNITKGTSPQLPSSIIVKTERKVP